MTILWLILKIILGLLGLLLGLFLFILLGILFLPLEYRIKAEKYETIAYDIYLRIFYLISILYDSQTQSSIKIQLLGKTIKTVPLSEEEVEVFKDVKDVQDVQGVKDKKDREDIEDIEDIKNRIDTKLSKVSKEEKNRTQEKIPLKEAVSKEEKAPRIRSINTGKSKKVKEKQKTKDVIHASNGWLENIKKLWNSEDRAPFLRFCKSLLKNLWYAIRPKAFSFRLIFGLDNPADTGMLLAKVMALYPFYAPYGDIIGDFEKPRLEGDIRLLGKTNLYRFIKPLIIFITHKEVRRYIKIIMNIGKGNEDGIKT